MQDCPAAEKQHGLDFSAPCNVTYIKWTLFTPLLIFQEQGNIGKVVRSVDELWQDATSTIQIGMD